MDSRNSQLDVAAVMASKVCAADGRAKNPGYPFCSTCFCALTIWQRKSVSDAASPTFADDYTSALEHLRAHPVRQQLYGSWPYRDMDELHAAGFRRCEQHHAGSWCKVPGCRANIWWYWTPSNHKIALDVATLRPHRETCADPDFHARQRAERAQAAATRRPRRSKKCA